MREVKKYNHTHGRGGRLSQVWSLLLWWRLWWRLWQMLWSWVEAQWWLIRQWARLWWSVSWVQVHRARMCCSGTFGCPCCQLEHENKLTAKKYQLITVIKIYLFQHSFIQNSYLPSTIPTLHPLLTQIQLSDLNYMYTLNQLPTP